LGAEHVGGGRPAFTDDGCQHDCAIDLAPAPLAGSCGGGLQNALEFGRYEHLLGSAGLCPFLDAAQVGRDVRRQADNVDVAEFQDDAGFGILGQRQKQMLHGHLKMALGLRIARRTR
jgi:hypothetical protein